MLRSTVAIIRRDAYSVYPVRRQGHEEAQGTVFEKHFYVSDLGFIVISRLSASRFARILIYDSLSNVGGGGRNAVVHFITKV